MGVLKDKSGQRYGRLTVIRRTENSKHPKWECVCDCGNIKSIYQSNLISGDAKSCGCYSLEEKIKNNTTHGLSKTRLFRIYQGMKNRCYNQNIKGYKDYGAKGIIICKDWLDDFVSFYNWSLKNSYADNLTIDRINTNGNYEPNNCRWATMKEQENNRTNNHLITFQNKTQTLSQWADEIKMDMNRLYSRIVKLGWSVEKAITTPVSTHKKLH